MKVILLRTLIPFPYASSERCGPVIRRDRPSLLVKAFRRSPDEVVSFRIRYGRSSFLEPCVIGGTAVTAGEGRFSRLVVYGNKQNIRAVFFSGSGYSLVDNEVKDDLHPPRMSLFDQPVAVFQRAVFGVDVLVIGNVVSLRKSQTTNGVSLREGVSQQDSVEAALSLPCLSPGFHSEAIPRSHRHRDHVEDNRVPR
jgi:hypothetical protein